MLPWDGSTVVDLRRRGLPCRAEGCFAVFRRAGDGESMLALQVVVADREQHERQAHGLIARGPGSTDAPGMVISPHRSVRSEPVPGEQGREGASLRRRLLELLRGGPSTFAELADAFEVPDKHVRSELKVFLAAGLVRIQPNLNPGRGRPRHRYALTADAEELVGGRTESEARELLIDARAVGGEKLIEEIFRMRSLRLARHYRSRVSGSLREQVESTTSILEEHRGRVEVIQLAVDSFVLSVRGSRILNVGSDDSRLCAYQLDLLQHLLHAPVVLSEERRESGECVYVIGRAAQGAAQATASVEAARPEQAQSDRKPAPA